MFILCCTRYAWDVLQYLVIYACLSGDAVMDINGLKFTVPMLFYTELFFYAFDDQFLLDLHTRGIFGRVYKSEVCSF